MQSKHSKPVNSKKDIIIRRILISIIVVCLIAVLIFLGISCYNNEAKTKTTPEVISQITNTIPGYDFEKLKQTYPDIIGWIEVPNTNINMPLVQHPSNDFYYLQHGPQGNSDINGSAYIESCNKSNFTDPVTVIYGHTMNDHSLMFGTQHNFENPQFFNDNDKFYVFTPGHRLTYTVCLAYAYGDGKHESCKYTVSAVSRLLYNMPIKNYLSLNLEGISALNDAVGGITLVPIESIPNTNIVKGEKITLYGKNAERYFRYRSQNDLFSAEQRRAREVQYVQAFYKQAFGSFGKDLGAAINLFNIASQYSITNLGIPEFSYLANFVIKSGVTSFKIDSVSGEMKLGNPYVEFHPDQEKLYE